MAKVQVGIVAFRDEKGNFLPGTKPIYREIPDEPPKGRELAGVTGAAEESRDPIRIFDAPLTKEAEDGLIRLFADMYMAHKRKLREAEKTRN